ncbi:MAG: hypothetical protein WD077_01775 [Bacteroidia bacterium]
MGQMKTLLHQKLWSTKALCWASVLVILMIINNLRDWEDYKQVIYWDTLSYYAYLPAAFIHGDLSLKFTSKAPAAYSQKFWPNTTPEGYKVIKTTMGLAYLYAPFFFIAHGAAHVLGYQTDGFSDPYSLMMLLGVVFYFAIGLFALRKILLRYFSPFVTGLTLIAVVFATNLFHYTFEQSTVAHTYNFMLFNIFIGLSILWHERPNWKTSLFLGFVFGLIVLIRPTNILIGLFFLLFGITSVARLKEQFRKFGRHWQLLLLMAAASQFPWIPQYLYWKLFAGQWIFWSYTGERFFFNDPEVLNVLFSYRKGWLLYTPIMAFALVGIFFLRQQLKPFFLPILIFTILNFYVISSWWCWWWGGCYGQRAFVDSYGLMAFPLAALMAWSLKKHFATRVATLVLVTLLTAHGIFQTAQYHYGAIHYDAMTKEAYLHQFLRLRQGPLFWKYVKTPDYKAARKNEE